MKLERKVRLCSAAAAVLIAAIALTGCGGSKSTASSAAASSTNARFCRACSPRCCHQQQLRRGRDLGTG